MGPDGRQGGGLPDPPPTPGMSGGFRSGGSASASTSSGYGSGGEPSQPGSGASSAWGLPSLADGPTPPPRRSTSMPGRSEPAGERRSSLTAQLRAMQPPDVAGQALRELDILARELASVPLALAQAGLARDQQRSYFETVDAYVDLAQTAWIAIAEERLEQAGQEPEYRQQAIGVARRLTRMQQLGRVGMQAPTGARPPWLWRGRMRLMRDGLRDWQVCLVSPVDPRRTGKGLFRLRGKLSLANASGFDLLTSRLLTGAALLATPLAALGVAVAAVAALMAGQNAQAASLAGVTLVSLAIVALVLMMTALGGAPLAALLASSCYSRTGSPCNGGAGSTFTRVVLRGWWLLVGLAGMLGVLLALALALRQQLAAGAGTTTESVTTLLGRAGLAVARVAAWPALAAVAAILALALPALVLSGWRLAGELGGHPTWVPAARRYALRPSAVTVALGSGALFAAVIAIATHAGWQHATLLSVRVGLLSVAPTWRAVAGFAALALPWLALHEGAYRLGIARWRAEWRGELAARRAALKSHVRRLSAADPRDGSQDTSVGNLRAMQYDMVLLDFYRAKDAEAGQIASSPHGAAGLFLSLILALLCALLTDGLGTWLVLSAPIGRAFVR